MEALVEFQDAVQRELAWRKREISAIRTQSFQAEEAANHVFRGGQVLLCAHSEGFLKSTTGLYIEHVFAQDVRVRDLTPQFIAIAYFGAVRKVAGAKFPGSEEHHLALAARILATFDRRVTAPAWKVDTEGNPTSEVVERILKSIGVDPHLGMDAAGWATTRVFINEHLVRDRNHVAHGEWLQPSRQSMLERAQRLLELLDQLASQVFLLAETRPYLT